MKRHLLYISTIFLITNPSSAEVPRELHKSCLEARDYSGCIRTNQRSQLRFKREMNGIGVTLFLNIDTAELTIHSVIDGSAAKKGGIQSGDVILKINGKTTRGMGLKEAIQLIKGPKGSQLKLVLTRRNEEGRKEIATNLIRDTFLIPHENSMKQLIIREFFNYGFPEDLELMIPNDTYPSESYKESLIIQRI